MTRSYTTSMIRVISVGVAARDHCAKSRRSAYTAITSSFSPWMNVSVDVSESECRFKYMKFVTSFLYCYHAQIAGPLPNDRGSISRQIENRRQFDEAVPSVQHEVDQVFVTIIDELRLVEKHTAVIFDARIQHRMADASNQCLAYHIGRHPNSNLLAPRNHALRK